MDIKRILTPHGINCKTYSYNYFTITASRKEEEIVCGEDEKYLLV